ncbi:MAG: alpha/beta fold hydrolase [Ignavibacteriae bacterium]|nr:alpha/beta fold hydrolase [Ignavibacteriota bacterium]
MPLIPFSDFAPPFLLRNHHVQTILPTVIRRVKKPLYIRERFETSDGDFFDVDWSQVNDAEQVVLLIHGLESSSDSNYIRGMVNAFNRRGWDAAVMNFRGCSGTINRLYKSYHSGATDDIHTVVRSVFSREIYREISIVGFSLGGNATLKYLGEQAQHVLVSRASAVSVPCDLKASALRMAMPENKLYMKRFIRSFQEKLLRKKSLLPDGITLDYFTGMRTFQQLDDRYTAPAHGYKDAEEYWAKCSATQFIPRITVPTLLISAKDDSFLGKTCFPIKEAEESSNFYLEIPDNGGHLGFMKWSGEYWHETRITEFITGK